MRWWRTGEQVSGEDEDEQVGWFRCQEQQAGGRGGVWPQNMYSHLDWLNEGLNETQNRDGQLVREQLC